MRLQMRAWRRQASLAGDTVVDLSLARASALVSLRSSVGTEGGQQNIKNVTPGLNNPTTHARGAYHQREAA